MSANVSKYCSLVTLVSLLLAGCQSLPRVDEVTPNTPQSTLDKMTENLVLSKAPNIKLIHPPSDQAIAYLEAKGVRFNKQGCPSGWDFDSPGWMHPDAMHATPGCLFNDDAHFDLPIKVDYWPKNERPDIDNNKIEH